MHTLAYVHAYARAHCPRACISEEGRHLELDKLYVSCGRGETMVILLLLRNPELSHSTTVWLCARGRWRGVGDVRSSLGQTRVNPRSTMDLLSVWTRLRGPPSLVPQMLN